MENILCSFFETAEPQELAAFGAELESVIAVCPAPDTEGILSRSLGKAGFKPAPAKKKKRRRLIILIAAAVILLMTVGFVANFDKLDVYFGLRDKGSPFAEIFETRKVSASNDDLTLTIDGAFSDEVRSRFMISLTAKTREGRKTIDKIERVFHLTKGYADREFTDEEFIEVYGDIDRSELKKTGSDFHTGFIYSQGIPDQTFDVWDLHLFGYNTASAFYFEVAFDKYDSIDPTKPMKITEAISGLTVEADLTPNVKTVRLISDDPDAYKNATVSPLGVHIVSPDDDPYAANKIITDPSVRDDSSDTVVIHKKDGTTVGAPHVEGLQVWPEKPKEGAPEAGNDSIGPKRVDSYANLEERTMIEEIDHVTILGIDYRLEQ